MFEAKKKQTQLSVTLSMFAVIFHMTAHSIRSKHTNAFAAIAINMIQVVMMVAVFFVMFELLGLRGAALRGDFLLYIMSGIFIFITNVKAMGSVAGSSGPSHPMMQHAPMNTFVAMVSAALGSLYIQVLCIMLILIIYHTAFTPIEIYRPIQAFMMILLAWFNGAAIGLVFLALKPWFPQLTGISQTIYMRVNMFASGKMFVANSAPFYLIAMVSWNPLFHIVDQTRGFTFINYNPHYTNWMYPLVFSFVIMLIGFMGENYSRKHVSASWAARQ
ncbi:ABC-type polysaccharide/polyol phosphate export permease [Aliiroseovarius halocynthiae]|uniref:ABC transporter permease n=1 Tax=Aliiroseovarius halocynthiae TaxID=985055 RepID=A0A545SP45_9RHOB|nr:ABC transporter permease [Aliiroseovarius halocynthiae]TQV66636.1 ABC transporter permease [Aliiroseovarius halocynthiae]SMR82488.1 ABC-type polysaccharide/polyol phosphate export permease [Aliiroseovarius halocynthiae]